MTVRRPLAVAALGFLLTALYLRVGGYDVLPDPIGWALVGIGSAAVPALPLRRLVLGLTALAAVVALVLLPPSVAGWLAEEPALGWAASLPAFAAPAVLAHALTLGARSAADEAAAGWFAALRTTTIVVALLPTLVFGAGFTGLLGLSASLSSLVVVAIPVLLIVYSGRAWTQPPDPGRSGPPR